MIKTNLINGLVFLLSLPITSEILITLGPPQGQQLAQGKDKLTSLGRRVF
jgi:hypothetical protein